EGRGMVGDNEVARREEGSESGARQMPHAAVAIDNEEFGGSAAGAVSGCHWCFGMRRAIGLAGHLAAPQQFPRRHPLAALTSLYRHRERPLRATACPCRRDRATEKRYRRPFLPRPKLPSDGGAPLCWRRKRPTPNRD